MTSSADSVRLVYNARIWQSEGDDATWMTFNTDTGHIAAVGRHNPPPLNLFPPDRRRDAGLFYSQFTPPDATQLDRRDDLRWAGSVNWLLAIYLSLCCVDTLLVCRAITNSVVILLVTFFSTDRISVCGRGCLFIFVNTIASERLNI